MDLTNIIASSMLAAIGGDGADQWRYIVLSFIISFVVLAIVFVILLLRYQHVRYKQKQLLNKYKQVVPSNIDINHK